MSIGTPSLAWTLHSTIKTILKLKHRLVPFVVLFAVMKHEPETARSSLGDVLFETSLAAQPLPYAQSHRP